MSLRSATKELLLDPFVFQILVIYLMAGSTFACIVYQTSTPDEGEKLFNEQILSEYMEPLRENKVVSISIASSEYSIVYAKEAGATPMTQGVSSTCELLVVLEKDGALVQDVFLMSSSCSPGFTEMKLKDVLFFDPFYQVKLDPEVVNERAFKSDIFSLGQYEKLKDRSAAFFPQVLTHIDAMHARYDRLSADLGSL